MLQEEHVVILEKISGMSEKQKKSTQESFIYNRPSESEGCFLSEGQEESKKSFLSEGQEENNIKTKSCKILR